MRIPPAGLYFYLGNTFSRVRESSEPTPFLDSTAPTPSDLCEGLDPGPQAAEMGFLPGIDGGEGDALISNDPDTNTMQLR